MSAVTRTDESKDDSADQKDTFKGNGVAFTPTQLLDLNDCCLIAILKKLPTNFDFHSIASTCTRLESLARIAFKSRKSCKTWNIQEMITKYEPNEIEEIQRYLHNFGASITDIKFSLAYLWHKDIPYGTTSVRNRVIFDGIVEFCGDTLEKLDMTNILMGLSSLPANTYYFQNLTSFRVSGCYDCSLNSSGMRGIPYYFAKLIDLTISACRLKSGNNQQFAKELNDDTLANFLKCVPNPNKLQELCIYERELNSDYVMAISKFVELETFELHLCIRIANDNVHLLNNLKKVTKLILNSGAYSYDGLLVLQNIGSTDSLERLTLRGFYNRPHELLAALRDFNNLQFVHFGDVCGLETNHFNELDNFRSVREFSLDTWTSRSISMNDLVVIVTVMDNLETLVILSADIDGEDDDDELTTETYMKLVSICRHADRKLILRLAGLNVRHDELYGVDIDQKIYVENKKYVEFRELEVDDYFY